MTALAALIEAQRHGVQLQIRGDKLIVSPVSRCPPGFLEVLRFHKGELVSYLEATTAALPEDCKPWLHMAKQILAGEFDGCDRSTKQSLIIGLRSVRHPICQQALEKLNQEGRPSPR